MWRWTKRVLVALVCVLFLAAFAGATYEWSAARRSMAATPPPGQLVDVGGHRLHIWCTGSGSPVVILETGLGGSAVDWGFVQPEVARFTRVCSYDRAGLGYSDAGPAPRTGRQMARELASLLDRIGTQDPVVLVGASSGGLNVRIFASEHPDRVSGLVLVDAAHEDQNHEIPPIARFVPALASLGVLRLLGISFGPPIESLAAPVRDYGKATQFRAQGYKAAAGEVINFEKTAAEVRQSRRRLTSPVIVVTGGRNADTRWRELQRDQLTLSSRSCHVIAEQSGHVVMVDQPGVVTDAIREIVDIARGRGGAAPARDCVQ